MGEKIQISCEIQLNFYSNGGSISDWLDRTDEKVE